MIMEHNHTTLRRSGLISSLKTQQHPVIITILRSGNDQLVISSCIDIDNKMSTLACK